MSQIRRKVVLDAGAYLAVALNVNDDPERAAISIDASASTVQIGIPMSRDQLIALHTAIDVVLAEQGAS